jgi:hypothetical protein
MAGPLKEKAKDITTIEDDSMLSGIDGARLATAGSRTFRSHHMGKGIMSFSK